MAVSAITSIRRVIGYKGSARKSSESSLQRDDSLDTVPTVGFRVGYTKGTNKLQVRVLGARHLPSKINRAAVSGYSVKVKLFPGKDRFETETKPESWPTYNEDFSFEIPYATITRKSKDLSEVLKASNFIVFTVYAEESNKKKRAIGAATWPLDHTVFKHKLHTHDFGDNEELETPDIWRRAQELSSGISGAKQKRDEKNNQLEVSLRYSPGKPEEGEPDSLILGVTKLRWSLEATREYEQKNALLYVKLNLMEDGVRSIKACKTKRFAPNISVHFKGEKDNSVLTAPLPLDRDVLSCVLSLCTKPTIGKKTVFGRVVIGPTEKDDGAGSEHWERVFQTPDVTVTRWHCIR